MSSIHHWRTVLGIALVGLAAVAASCGGDDGKTDSKSAGDTSATRVNVTMADYSLTTALKSVKAGEVRFYAKNTGKVVHELVIVQSDAKITELPVYSDKDKPAEGHAPGDVDEAKITSEGEVEDIDPGATKDATFVLAAGKYVLICNLASHYGLGMRVAFTVE